ncbi:MAG: hypothetical protein J0H02_17415 [Armatimonadetes bacterium]|nr:hypothetical protein [Armatimonadota bacterium]
MHREFEAQRRERMLFLNGQTGVKMEERVQKLWAEMGDLEEALMLKVSFGNLLKTVTVTVLPREMAVESLKGAAVKGLHFERVHRLEFLHRGVSLALTDSNWSWVEFAVTELTASGHGFLMRFRWEGGGRVLEIECEDLWVSDEIWTEDADFPFLDSTYVTEEDWADFV